METTKFKFSPVSEKKVYTNRMNLLIQYSAEILSNVKLIEIVVASELFKWDSSKLLPIKSY